MMRATILALATVLGLASLSVAAVQDPDPMGLDATRAEVRGKTVSVPVQNHSLEPIQVEVTAMYLLDGTLHTVREVVSLAAKESRVVELRFKTIVDDINPQVGITEGPDPMPQTIVLGTALWVD